MAHDCRLRARQRQPTIVIVDPVPLFRAPRNVDRGRGSPDSIRRLRLRRARAEIQQPHARWTGLHKDDAISIGTVRNVATRNMADAGTDRALHCICQAYICILQPPMRPERYFTKSGVIAN